MNEHADAKRELLDLIECMPEAEQDAFTKVMKYWVNRPPGTPPPTEQEFNDMMDAAKRNH